MTCRGIASGAIDVAAGGTRTSLTWSPPLNVRAIALCDDPSTSRNTIVVKRSTNVGHEHVDLAAPPLRVLVIANRTAATPDLVAAVRRYADQRPTSFTLLIPDAPRAEHPDWTPELALSLLQRAARGRVTELTGRHRDPCAAARTVVTANGVDRIIVSTLPDRASKWLRRDLPRQLESLGVPIEVIGPARAKLSDITGAPMMSGCELWLKTRYGDEERLSAASIRSRRLSS